MNDMPRVINMTSSEYILELNDILSGSAVKNKEWRARGDLNPRIFISKSIFEPTGMELMKMDKWKYYDITHKHHVLCNPMSEEK
ncbi:MAG: hypothetical protein ACFFCP_17155, partial [Promethearchaeota archaeon]